MTSATYSRLAKTIYYPSMFESRKKKNQQILKNHKAIKSTNFDFERIALFFSLTDKTDAHQIISDITFHELDFDQLFMYIDRTCTRIGQQYLYSTLRTIPKDKNQCLRFEQIIKYLNENPELKDPTVLELSRLNTPGAYFIQSLFHEKSLLKPRWFWAVPLLSGSFIATSLLSIAFPALLLAVLPLLIVNFFVHYWNKTNILGYSNSIPQLLILNQVAKKLLQKGVIQVEDNRFQNSLEAIDKIAAKAVFFKLEVRLQSDIGQAL